VEAIVDKLVRRHPHVFGETNIESAEAQTRAWEAHKAEERRAKAAGAEVPHSVLDGIALTLPALSRAAKLQKRAAQVGFDWPEIDGAVDKIEEELEELREEVGQENQKRINDEMGDLLFSCVNLARFAGVDPESALRGANAKFERRFRGIEALLAAQGTRPEKASLEEMDALWDRVKQEETGAAPVRALNRGRPEGS
jgi:ATP diphosphatase